MENSKPHYLYNYRRCPYAMRARVALVKAGISFTCENINFRDKPARMLELSPKGTVPILVLRDGGVLEESLDIVRWALPDEWERADHALIADNDGWFKRALDIYKYADRHNEEDVKQARETVEEFFDKLNGQVNLNSGISVTDICIFPFIRQCANVDRDWFDGLPYPNTQQWLAACVESQLFLKIFDKNFTGV